MTQHKQEVYNQWKDLAAKIPESGDVNWKQSGISYMLEHVSPEFGKVYKELLLKKLNRMDINNICLLNDCIGYRMINSPTPSSLRYLYHALCIYEHIRSKNLSSITLLEIGSGYSGLVVIIDQLFKLFSEKNSECVKDILSVKINKYMIIDLPEVQVLQKWYLSQFNISFPVEWKESCNFGKDIEMPMNIDGIEKNDGIFLISNYALGEFTNDIKDAYLDNILPKICGGFLLWNSVSSTDRLPSYRKEEPEYPQTGINNKVITF